VNSLPDGFSVKEETGGQRSWVYEDKAYVIARPFPVSGFSQYGWEVSVISLSGAATITIRYDELDLFAAWHCQFMAKVLASAVTA